MMKIKLSLNILLFCVFAFISACAVKKPAVSLVGVWTLTETLSDPGDGSGKWVRAVDNSALQFNLDGTVISKGFDDFKSYRLTDSAHIEFTMNDNRTISYRYKLSETSLEINPPCREACGFKLVRLGNL